MSLLDRAEDEIPKKSRKAKEPEPIVDDEFDNLLGMEKQKWQTQQKLDDILPKMDNLAQLSATDTYPRVTVKAEDVFILHRRERIKRILMQFGDQTYIDSITNLLKIFDDPDNMEAEGENVIKKLGTYGAEAAQLIGWLTACRYLIGHGKTEGLLHIRKDEVFYEKYEEALKKVVELQTTIPAGVDKKTGEVKYLAPSSISTSDKMIESWIVNNVPEYNELRKDITVVSTIAETIKLTLWQLNASADSMNAIIKQYPAPMLGKN